MIDFSDSDSISDFKNLANDHTSEIFGVAPSETVTFGDDQEILRALAYSAPDVPLNPQLKNRLFESLGLQSSVDIYALLNLSIQELKLKTGALAWEAMSEAPGFDMAIYHSDESTRTMACFLRADFAASFPSHTHTAEEVILVLSGDLIEEGQAYKSGDRLHSGKGTSHRLNTSQGCLILCITSMDNQFD